MVIKGDIHIKRGQFSVIGKDKEEQGSRHSATPSGGQQAEGRQSPQLTSPAPLKEDVKSRSDNSEPECVAPGWRAKLTQWLEPFSLHSDTEKQDEADKGYDSAFSESLKLSNDDWKSIRKGTGATATRSASDGGEGSESSSKDIEYRGLDDALEANEASDDVASSTLATVYANKYRIF